MAIKRKEYKFQRGRIVEIQEFHDGNYGGPGKKRIKRKKPTEEQMRLVNAKNVLDATVDEVKQRLGKAE